MSNKTEREPEDYEDTTYLELEPRDEEEIERENEARKVQKQKLDQYLDAHVKGKVQPQLFIDRVMWDFAQSELTKDSLKMVKRAVREDSFVQLFEHYIPKQFEYVTNGYERDMLKTTNYKSFQSNNSKQQAAVPDQLLKIVQKNTKNAVQALQAFENSKQQDLNENWLTDGSLLTLQISLAQAPTFHLVLNPEPIAIPNSIYGKSSEILIIAQDKEHKTLIKQQVNMENTKVMKWDKFETIYKNAEQRAKIAAAYDLVFVDFALHKVYQTLNQAFFAKNPIPIVLPEQLSAWNAYIKKFVTGTSIQVYRGAQNITINVGYSQMDASKVEQNIVAILKNIAAFVPHGYQNIVQLDIATSSSPKLSIYRNRKAKEAQFKLHKTFALEKKYRPPPAAKDESNNEDGEDAAVKEPPAKKRKVETTAPAKPSNKQTKAATPKKAKKPRVDLSSIEDE